MADLYQEVVQRERCNRGVRMKFPANLNGILRMGLYKKVPHVA